MDTEGIQPQASVSKDPSAEMRAKGTEYYQAGNWQVRFHSLADLREKHGTAQVVQWLPKRHCLESEQPTCGWHLLGRLATCITYIICTICIAFAAGFWWGYSARLLSARRVHFMVFHSWDLISPYGLQSALAAYKEAAALAPDVAANPANCAAAALMLGRYKEAAEFAAQAAALDSTSVRAHMRAGKACLSMGRFDEVSAHLKIKAGWVGAV